MSDRPLIAHVLYSFGTGGMERVAVSVINRTTQRCRHAVVCLAGLGAMRTYIKDPAVSCVSLDKRPGKDWRCYARFRRALHQLRPNLVQTYNIGTLDLAPIARLSGVRHVIHAEHGRDVSDPRGDNRRYRRLRRWVAPFLDRYVAVSRDLEAWLVNDVGIARAKVTYVPNGIDTTAFHAPRRSVRRRPALADVVRPDAVVVGNVARLDQVKDHANLLRAFRLLRDRVPETECHLVIAGDGPERTSLLALRDQLSLADRVHLLGNRSDVADVLADCDVFVLSSIAEGMPLTVLEAMASGLPVVATDVGSIRDAVADGQTGCLVVPGDPAALAAAMGTYVVDPELRERHGLAGRERADERFGMNAMISAYVALYDDLLAGRTGKSPVPAAELLSRGGR